MLTFGEAFAAMIRKRNMSVSSASALLGFSSKTALFRILNGQSKPSSNKKCLEIARKSEAFALTNEEIDELTTALKISIIGKQAYAMQGLLRDLLHPRLPDVSPDPVVIEGMEGADTLGELLDRCAPLADIHIGIFGECPQPVLTQLHGFTQRADVHEIHHLVPMDEQNPEHMRALSSASMILFSPAYSVYAVGKTEYPECNWPFYSGIILLCGTDRQGERLSYQLTPLSNGAYLALMTKQGAVTSLWKRLICDAMDRIRPIKTQCQPDSCSAFPQNYIDFTEEYRNIEHNREIFMMKPDLPFCCISPEIMKPIVQDGFAKNCDSPDTLALFDRLYEIQKGRFDNMFGKKKVTHLVLNREAMCRFAKTGQREDHFFLGRPYNSQERVAILSHVLNQARDNPYFNVWFSKNPDLVIDKEVTAYENYGVAIIKSNTSWHLEKDHQEIMLESRALASSFREYVLAEIIPGEVMTRAKSLAVLEQLIAMAAES